MIGLVLRDARRESLERQLERPCRARSSARTVMSVQRGTIPRMSGMLRQPSQPSVFVLSTGTISGLMMTVASDFGPGSSSSSATKMPDVLVDLRRGQPDAVVFVHRLDHVVDELLQQHVPQLRWLHGSRAFPQHGMTHARDFENRHEGRL